MLTRSGFIKAAVAAVIAAVAGSKRKPEPPVIYYNSQALGKSFPGMTVPRLYCIDYVIQSQAAPAMFAQMVREHEHDGGIMVC